MTSVMVLMSEWFDAVRWAGALYLAYLGGRQLWLFWRSNDNAERASPSSRGNCYVQGLLVSLANPKVILFLGAFLPQFVDSRGDSVWQLSVLAVVFVVVLATVDIGYTLAIARVRAKFAMARLRILEGAAGVLLLISGLALATARRP
jgi:threonine/homoserine/homoserine lactone efflux protein